MATILKLALDALPVREREELKLFLEGIPSQYDGPYGFTSQNVMVRGNRVNIGDADKVFTRAKVHQALKEPAHA